MKTNKTNIIIFALFAIFTVFAFISCENPVALGGRLDVTGPVVEFTAPVPRKAVTEQFTLEGTASDENGVKKLVIKASRNREDISMQWRYDSGLWEVSNDFGASWKAFSGAKWEGSARQGTWTVPVDLGDPEDGEYLFSAQAWDQSGFSDDNSFKTLVLIIDKEPPAVSISNPFLHDRYAKYFADEDKFIYSSGNTVTDLTALHQLADLSGEWRNPVMIGKFQTYEFQMQWQIEDSYDIWSFDLRFYDAADPGIVIDQDPETAVSDDYIYRYVKNDLPPPEAPQPGSYLKPNGSVRLPALDGEVKDYGEDRGILRKKITQKTTVVVVAICYDAAKNVNQEKILGYFIYWPLADTPWITYSGEIHPPSAYTASPGDTTISKAKLDAEAFMIYPGRDIKAIAYHAQGLKEVTFNLYLCEESGPEGSRIITLPASTATPYEGFKDVKRTNIPRGNGNYSTSFAWDFRPPPRSAYSLVKATAVSVNGKTSEEEVAIFRVQDITFPDFPEPPSPSASDPLFIAIHTAAGQPSITISGSVTDATRVDSLCLAWINPESPGYAAMSQLEYFRDQDYAGWKTALALTPNGPSGTEGLYAPGAPNKVWRLALTHTGEDDRSRQLFTYSRTIPLSEINILGGTNQPLASQVFLLRAENPDKRATIITYTPQGDTLPPTMTIDYVRINNAPEADWLIPGRFKELQAFDENRNDTIEIVGKWTEDSTGYLTFANYPGGSFANKFQITLNQRYTIPVSAITFNHGTNTTPTSGTWTATVTTNQNGLNVDYLKDTFVVSAKLSDIGGGEIEVGASWLISSDTLRLLRISSENADQTYSRNSTPNTIGIFLEFNKPVQLTHSYTAGNEPQLQLSIAGATAKYRAGQSTQNTRQYFDYEIAAGQNTAGAYLDVTNLVNGQATPSISDNYAFTWHNITGGSREEIRVTTGTQDGLTSAGTVNGSPVYLRRLPTTTSTVTGDASLTLAAGKRIEIDTTAPRPVAATPIRSSNPAGHYAVGAEIYIEVEFDERVMVGTGTNLPRLEFTLQNRTAYTEESAALVKVNGNTVTFVYKAAAGDTTGTNRLTVLRHTGTITDLAGNPLAATGTGSIANVSAANRTLNGGRENLAASAGIFIDTTAVGVPTLKIISNNAGYSNGSTANLVNNTFAGTPSSASATTLSATADVALRNLYHTNLWLAIDGNTTGGTYKLRYLEYTLDNGVNWKRVTPTGTNTFYTEAWAKTGENSIKVRQIDYAGNISPVSYAIGFNWDPGTLVTRIDSEKPNGTYTNNGGTRQDTIPIDVYFRKPVTVTAFNLQLNATTTAAGNPAVTLTNGNTTGNSYDSANNYYRINYAIGTNHNTAAGVNLDVVAANFSITAQDAQGVIVTNLITRPAAASRLLLGERKQLSVQTGALAITTGPTYARTNTGNDSWEGTITFTFPRHLSKTSSGSVQVTQQTAGYRLPAVLTESQSTSYRSARNFDTYYSRGTNGFTAGTGANAGTMDTATKYILRYDTETVVTPSNTGSALEQMAYDFLQAERVSLPVASDAVRITNSTTDNTSTLVITINGTNALAVLGAAYDIVFAQNFVQDSLGYTWPAAAGGQSYNMTMEGINRPYARIDKKIDADRISSVTGSATMPHLTADLTNVLQSRARLDCRTPNSVVRYVVGSNTHEADGTGLTLTGWGANVNNATSQWRNTGTGADGADDMYIPTAGTITAAGGTNVRTYNTFTGASTGNTGTHITVGDTNYQGYAWRITMMSRNSATGNVNSGSYEDIAFRTVLTYVMNGATQNSNLGQNLAAGDQLWIRGGDAISSSSVPGYPLTYGDDYGVLASSGKRAGARLLYRQSSTTSLAADSVWKWVSWEINVETFFEILLGRGGNANTVAQNANDAWQYGPREWAYTRGGWAPAKTYYSLQPGKHRWLRHMGYQNYTPGGLLNWSNGMNVRVAPAVTYTQPGT
jgi:hypothetical protein